MTDAYAGQVQRQRDEARAEIERLRAHILDIDAHATPYGDLPDEPGYVGTYLLTAGALHRALGTIGHSAVSCQAEAELASLHAGEEPFEDELVTPTPGQWIWRWNRGTPEQRLVWAEHVVAAISNAHRCAVGFHEERVADQRHAIRRAGAAKRRAEKAEARIAAARALHQPAECVNVRCKAKQWCSGCDPEGLDDCSEHPWPCPTIAALDGPAEQPADDREPPSAEAGRNAEDCPACDGTNPPYPFICPGHPAGGAS